MRWEEAALRYHHQTGGPNLLDTEVHLMISDVSMPINRRLALLETTCSAMWILLKNYTGATDEELLAEIQALDQTRRSEGRFAAAPRDCPNCGKRLLAPNTPKCSWCGADVPPAVTQSARPPKEEEIGGDDEPSTP